MATTAKDAPFSLASEGEETGQMYLGDFRAKVRFSHRDHLRIDQVRRELLGGATGEVTQRARDTATILSELSVRLTESPDWWKESNNGLDLCDDHVITEIYKAALKVEADFREEQTKKAEAVQAKLRGEVQAKEDAESKAGE